MRHSLRGLEAQRLLRTQLHLIPEDIEVGRILEEDVLLCLLEGRKAMGTKFQLLVSM